MARSLGDAFINISPDTSTFRGALAAKLKAAVAGLSADVKVAGDTTKLDAAIAKAQAKVAGLRASLSDVQLDANAKAFNAQIAAARANLAGLEAQASGLKLDADAKALTAKIAALQLQQARLADAMQSMTANVEIRAASTKILAIDAEIKYLQSQAQKVKVGADWSALNAAITAARAKVAALQDEAKDVKVGADISALTAQLAAAEAELKALQDKKINIGADTGAATQAVTRLGGAALLAGTGFAFLANKIPLFAGALKGVPFVSTVSVFHLLVDAILEVAAVVVPAGVAFAAFGVAASSTVADISRTEQAFFTITTAMKDMNVQFPGLNSGLQNFTDSVKPQVYVLFGEALNTINAHTGLFQQLATGAGNVLDNLGARAENALGGNGLNGLISHGVSDLQLLGNIVGNVFGTFGNVLKALPGYAELLFSGLQAVSGALESITSNSAVQTLLNIGLALHGAVLWGGLAVTALFALRGPLTGIVTWVAGAANALIKFGLMFSAVAAQEGILAAATATLQGVMAALGAVNPFVWVAVAVGALVGLAVWLGNMKSAAQQSLDAINKLAGEATSFTGVTQVLTNGLQQTNAQLANTPKYITRIVSSGKDMFQTVTELNPAYTELTGNVKALNTEQSLQASRLAELNKITGSAAATQADLQAIGVKGLDIYKLTAGAFQALITEVKGYASATSQLAGFQAGPAAAAQNALTNEYINEQLPAIQKITKAEEDLLTVITGGQTAFNNFQQSIQGTTAKFVSPSGLADAAKLAKGDLSGLNEQSLAFSNTLYNISIPSLQKLIGSLQEQGASTRQLTTVVATGAGQMLQYTGKNEEARAVIVALINNALGPGTVSLQNLNKWVAQNSTTLAGMNSIVAQSTVKAAGLAGVLNDDLVKAFQASLFQASGARTAIDQMTNAIVNQGTNSNNFRSARAALIADLEKTGLSSQQAKAYVDNLQASIDAMHGKTVPVDVHGSGSGTITASWDIGGTTVAKQNGHLVFFAGGGKVGGSGNSDTVPAMLTPGELVVPKGMVQAGAVDHLRGKLPGFASGGLVGGDLTGYTASQEGQFASKEETTFASAVLAEFNKEVAAAKAAAEAAAAAAKSSAGISAAGVSNSSAYAALQSAAAKKGWGSGPEWAALNNVELAEAGYNITATNPSSGAYGLAQFINGPSEYATYGGNANTAAGQAVAMVNYIAQRYGDPIAAWAHEQAYHWYGKGGIVKGYASGGLVGSLAAGQKAEQSAFAGVSGAVKAGLAHPSGYFASHKKSLASELTTITRRQASELADYAALAGKGLTAGNLRKFGTAAHSEISTAGDKYLSTAVSTKGLVAALQALDKLASSGAGTVSAAAGATKNTTSSAAQGGKEPPAGATTSARLGQQEKAEAGAFDAVVSALTSALAHPTAYVTSHKKSLTDELATLTKRQSSEVAAYGALSGKGLTTANLAKFASATRSEASTAKDKYLSTAVSTAALTAALSTLAASAAKGVIPSAAIAQANQSTTSTAKGTTSEGSAATSVLSEAQYTADFKAVKGLSLGEIQKSAHLSHLWHLLHLQHLADLGLNQGGIVPSRTFDQGGWLPTGTSLVHNNTGQPEQVIPPGGRRRLSPDAEAIIAALERNTAAVSAQGRTFASALNSTATSAAARGSYTTRRLFEKEVVPVPTSYRVTHSFPGDTKLFRQYPEDFSVCVPATALQDNLRCQLVHSVPLTAVGSTVSDPIRSLIFCRSAPVQVFRPPVIQLAARTVQTFVTFRARADEGQQHQSVHERFLLAQGDPVVTMTYPRVKKTPGKMPDCGSVPRVGIRNASIQAPNASTATHFVRALVPRDGQPAFGGRIRHSRSFLPVRPGRCVASRDRAVVSQSLTGRR